MSSTSFSIITAPHNRRLSVLKAQIVIHILIFSTVILLVMQLISHTTAVWDIEDYHMPPAWGEAFVGQLFEGAEMLGWVAVYLFVPLDGLHALLCVEWYTDQLHPVRRRRDVGKRRRAIKAWLNSVRQSLEAWRKRHIGWFGTRDGKDDSQDSAHDMKCRPATPQHVPQSCSSTHWIENPKTTPSPPSPLSPHTYHPLLHSTYTSLTRHILLSLWDIIMILTLVSHVYNYAANIRPSLLFCDEHDYPLWQFRVGSSTLHERCTRINWRIHSAGGCSATGAVILALWHLCALVSRLWGILDEKVFRRLEGETLERFKSRLRARRKGDDKTEVELTDWQYPPRDVDVRSRSNRKSIKSGSLNGTQVASGHLPTVSQEELGIGLGRRRKRARERKSGTSSDSHAEKDVRSSKWSWRSEGFLECLV